MIQRADILTDDQMKQRYGTFYNRGAKLQLDRRNVPKSCWPLLPYAEFWGIRDDTTRDDLVKAAPTEIQRNLKYAVAAFNEALDEWLAGPAADRPPVSIEYIAFTTMRMAADYV